MKKLQNRFLAKDFTLIEMLTVVAIILILVSLMFPAMNKLRSQAGRLNCLNRVKDIAQMNLRFAGRNNGEVCLTVNAPLNDAKDRSDAGGPPGVLIPTATYFRWMSRMAEDEAGYAVPHVSAEWWKFLCDNVLPGWNRSANGWLNIAQKYWQIEKGGESRARMWPIDYYLVYGQGNFGTNENGRKSGRTYSCWAKDLITGEEYVATKITQTMLLANVARPGLRTYVTEHGEDVADDNAFHYVKFKKYDQQIDGTYAKGYGYIPGYGAAGIGKESIEEVGYSSFVQSHERFPKIKIDVEEGRHEGYTLHGFFDGHAEMIDVERVGSGQLPKGGDKAKDLKGIYGYVTSIDE